MMERDLGFLFDSAAGLAMPDIAFPGIQPIDGGSAAPELCQLGERWAPADHPSNAVGQVKLDGYRALYIGGPLVSREGFPLTQAAHSWRALQELERAFGKPMFFDGEYVHPQGLEFCSRPGGTIWLFDAVPLEVWRRNGTSAPLDHRLDMLLDRGQHCFGPALGALTAFPLPTAPEAQRKAEELIRLGYEGLFVKDRTSVYRRRRHGSWRKIKDWKVVPCEVAEVVTGAGGFRALVVNHHGAPNRIGCGFSRADRIKLLARGDRLVGQTVLIEFTGLTASGLMRDATFVRLQEGGEHA